MYINEYVNMFILGIFIHVTFLFSIFDIYFKSPIVKDVVAYQSQHEAVADRLVLFVVDGLRAESFVNYTTMKYLRSVPAYYGTHLLNIDLLDWFRNMEHGKA